MTLLTIILLACITFFTRYLFLHPSLPVRLGAKASHFLSFSAPAVITAIWLPIILVHDHQLNISPLNPYLIAATLAIIISVKTKSVYLTVGLSVLVFALVKFISAIQTPIL
jgi:branched-subunit amino acid transport protein